MYCQKCGFNNKSSSKFCENCGSVLFDNRNMNSENINRSYNSYNQNIGPLTFKDFLKKYKTACISFSIIFLVLLVGFLYFESDDDKGKENPKLAQDNISKEKNNLEDDQNEDDSELVEDNYDRTDPGGAPDLENMIISPSDQAQTHPNDTYNENYNNNYDNNYDDHYNNGVTNDINIHSADSNAWLVEGRLEHFPDRLIDGDLRTGWAKNIAEDPSDPNYFVIYLDQTSRVNGICLYAGYHKSEKLYYENARPRTIRVSDEIDSYEYVLNDSMSAQYIDFPSTMITYQIKVEILDFYQGSKYDDVVVSEVYLY